MTMGQIVMVSRASSSNEEDVLSFVKELMDQHGIGETDGPPCIPQKMLHVVPLLALGHLSWSAHGIFLQRWGEVLVAPLLKLLDTPIELRINGSSSL